MLFEFLGRDIEHVGHVKLFAPWPNRSDRPDATLHTPWQWLGLQNKLVDYYARHTRSFFLLLFMIQESFTLISCIHDFTDFEVRHLLGIGKSVIGMHISSEWLLGGRQKLFRPLSSSGNAAHCNKFLPQGKQNNEWSNENWINPRIGKWKAIWFELRGWKQTAANLVSIRSMKTEITCR